MSDTQAPKDPEQLRAEIEETRADLGDTVEALAAKTDVKARAKHAAGAATDQARQKLASAKEQVGQAAATVKGQATQAAGAVADTAGSAKDRLVQADVPGPARRPVPWAVIGAVVLAVAGFVVLRSRRGRS